MIHHLDSYVKLVRVILRLWSNPQNDSSNGLSLWIIQHTNSYGHVFLILKLQKEKKKLIEKDETIKGKIWNKTAKRSKTLETSFKKLINHKISTEKHLCINQTCIKLPWRCNERTLSIMILGAHIFLCAIRGALIN